MTDPNKKLSRQFQCREALWHKFEQMAKELECSVDYLINDAMKQYARQRGYGATTTAGPPMPPHAGGAAPASPAAHPAPPPLPVPPPAPGVAPPLPSAARPPAATLPLPTASAAPSSALPAPALSGRPTAVPSARGVGAPPPPPALGGGARRGPPPLARSLPPLPGAVRPQAPSGSLSIHYQGEVFPVTKERFIIGRGKQSSDLTIKDPNVSRQHAMIEFANGQYFIVDMGSTNGVEFQGQRVQRHSIGDGDVFNVCDHELRFSFH